AEPRVIHVSGMRPPRFTVVNIQRRRVRPRPRYERLLRKFSMSSKFTKPFSRVGRNATTVASTSTTGASQRRTPLRGEGGAVLADAGRGPRDFLLISLAEGLSVYRGHPERGGGGGLDGGEGRAERRRREAGRSRPRRPRGRTRGS